ncbi:hypothetical protein [Jidongwangia harbinensis]|uniref:hypothetical protein n=1 Tax=Jidongwangia harbinensis TaxID=2878561 RepID=UPI001CD9997A|nr:hypothetical protein [Jidongwangia harbinensis]MCA2217489.1 hypothetical protein [Jidongwangia harbinensis]
MLADVRVADHWKPNDPANLIDVAVRRWTTFDRRSKPSKQSPEDRVKDLLRGLRAAQGEDIIYEEPGWLEHVTECFAAALLTADNPEPPPRTSITEDR